MEMAVLKGDKTIRQISSASAYRVWFNYTRSYYRLVVSNMIFLFNEKNGMSSFPLTNSIIFQDGYCTTNQLLGFKWYVKFLASLKAPAERTVGRLQVEFQAYWVPKLVMQVLHLWDIQFYTPHCGLKKSCTIW